MSVGAVVSASGELVHTLALELEPDQFLAGWRPGAHLLFVPAFSDARPGEPVAVRLGIVGRPIHATVFGKVSSVRRVGRPSLPPGAELATDLASAPALHFLAAAARGEEVSFREREPRWLVSRPLYVARYSGRLAVATVNVSRTGCALFWEGAPPQPGRTLRLKLHDRLLEPTAETVVCWATATDEGSTVGLRLVSAGLARRAWARMAAAAERTGARFA